MLPDIPDRKKIPREHCVTLATRYAYAQKHGWTDLKRLIEARLRNGYHNALSKFFGWLITKGYYPYEAGLQEDQRQDRQHDPRHQPQAWSI